MRAFIIYLEEVPYTKESALECLRTCKENGIDAVLFPGFTPNRADREIADLDIHPFLGNGEKLYRIKNSKPGVRGCFMSHFALWNFAKRRDEPTLILEHDARITRPIPDVEFKDVLHLDTKRFGEEEPIVEGDYVIPFYEERKGHKTMVGAYAYVVKPHTAERLVRLAFKDGFTAADMHISSRAGIELEAIVPRCAIVSSAESLTSDRNFSV